MMKTFFLSLFVLLMPLCGFAHEPMQHECSAPIRPVDDTDDVQWRRFLAEIDAFRSCVNAHMEFHQQAAEAHHAQARASVEAWNDFVHTSLNAPEDFPWPPE